MNYLDNYKPIQNKDWQLHWLDEQPLLFSKSHDDLHLLNSVAGFIWTCCDGKTEISAIRQALQEMFGHNQSEIDTDLFKILETWQKQELIYFNQEPDFIFIGGQKCGSTSMYKFFPKVKLIVLLRNPVDRLVSHYNMNLKISLDSLSLCETLDYEIDRTQADWEKIIVKDTNYSYNDYGNFSYLARGIYIEQLKRWMTFFPKEQFIILSSEDFFRKPATILNQVFGFLGLSHYQLNEYKQYHKSTYSSISQSTLRTLAEFYKPYNQQLEEFLGMSFNWNSAE
ncbi:MAG: PqqD family peptide modification chaperone, partial [Candidatus Marithrix sp.]|nr:PqqD family peptide modification chaperone [Candidatus Marithrix sp.]